MKPILNETHYPDEFAKKALDICEEEYPYPYSIAACDHGAAGYHADPFYGGIMDAFRQPKTSYYMFMAQRSPEKSDLIADNGSMIYIAHEITPFSPMDVTVYSNCEEIRLTVFKGGKNMSIKKIRIIKVCLLRSSLEFETVANDQKEIFLQEELLGGGESRSNMKKVVSKSDLERENERLRKELNQLKVKEVEKQQTQFGVGIND